jgi:hypothetical protein
MKYRVNIDGNVSAPCYCQPQVSFEYSCNQGSITIVVGQKAQSSLIYPGLKKGTLVVRCIYENNSLQLNPVAFFTQIEDVMLVIPFSRNVRTANLNVTVGSILFDEATKVNERHSL